jgi:phage-related holin
LAGAVITFAFGGWAESLTLLVVAMGIDYVTGIAATLKEGKMLKQRFCGRIGLPLPRAVTQNDRGA